METLAGRWWRPGNRDDEVFGRLEIDERRRMLLHLEGTFQLEPGIDAREVIPSRKVLHGVAHDGRHVELAGTFRTFSRSLWMTRSASGPLLCSSSTVWSSKVEASRWSSPAAERRVDLRRGQQEWCSRSERLVRGSPMR